MYAKIFFPWITAGEKWSSTGYNTFFIRSQISKIKDFNQLHISYF